jgi:isochorismate hydrolase
MYPDAPLIKRQGEVNAWDNSEFRDAIRATNKSQIIMAGIVTDVCKFQTGLPPPPSSRFPPK